MTEENINSSPNPEEEPELLPVLDAEQEMITPSEEIEPEDEAQISLFAEISDPEEQIPLWEEATEDPTPEISLTEDPQKEDVLSESFVISAQEVPVGVDPSTVTISFETPFNEDASEEEIETIPEVTEEIAEDQEELPMDEVVEDSSDEIVEPSEDILEASLNVLEELESPVVKDLSASDDFYLPMEEIPQRRRRIAEESVSTQEIPEKKKMGKKPGSAVSPLVEFVEIIVGALVAAILVLTLVCRTGVVEGGSMLPTMYDGDRYIISDLFYTPEQGDIVVFRPDIEGKDELWIKRVIAVEGQTVYIDPDSHQVYVDNVMLNEPYLEGMGTIPHSTQNPIKVPAGCVYVLGDNRGISHDSRYEDLGCVEIGQLAGRVILRFWPLESFGFCK